MDSLSLTLCLVSSSATMVGAKYVMSRCVEWSCVVCVMTLPLQLNDSRLILIFLVLDGCCCVSFIFGGSVGIGGKAFDSGFVGSSKSVDSIISFLCLFVLGFFSGIDRVGILLYEFVLRSVLNMSSIGGSFFLLLFTPFTGLNLLLMPLLRYLLGYPCLVSLVDLSCYLQMRCDLRTVILNPM